MRFWGWVLVSFGVIQSGCSSSKDSPVLAGGTGVGGYESNVLPASYQGQWSSGCPGYFETRVLLNPQSVRVETRLTDETGQCESKPIEIRVYEAKLPRFMRDLSGGREYLRFETYFKEPTLVTLSERTYSGASVQKANEEKICGFSDWQAGVAKSTIENECERSATQNKRSFDELSLDPEGKLTIYQFSSDINGAVTMTALPPLTLNP